MMAAALLIAVLAFFSPATIVGWPVALLLIGMATMFGGVISTEILTRRRP